MEKSPYYLGLDVGSTATKALVLDEGGAVVGRALAPSGTDFQEAGRAVTDAALDKANIDRFTQVLQDFLTWTQFIIVTHSKKTMTCANTLYGVTMQESGITKQVSVTFEDVSDEGEILPSALRRADETVDGAEEAA